MTTAVRYGALTLVALGLFGCAARPAVQAAATGSAPTTGSAPSTSTAASPATRAAAAAHPAPPGFPTHAPGGGLHSPAAARRLAQAMVAAVPVPPGAQLQTAPPPAELTAGTSAGVDTKVDVERWYTVPGGRDSAITWLETHGPATFRFFEALKVAGSGPASQYPRFLSLGSDTPSRQPLASTQASVLQDGSHADVRVSVEVVWTPAKTPIEIIPASVRTGVLHYQRPDQTGSPALDKRVRLSAAEAVQLRRTLNALPPVPPGVSSCPPPPDSAMLTFRYGGHTVVFTVDTGGCAFITMSVDGVPQQPYTRGGYALGGTLRVMAGLPATAPGS